MKRFWFVVLMLALAGCAKAPPKMAGAKWANALRDSDPRVRRKAAFTLGNIGPNDPAVLPALTGALKDLDAGVRREAVLALTKYGPGAQEAVATLTDLQEHDPDAQVRDYAVRALRKLRGERGPSP